MAELGIQVFDLGRRAAADSTAIQKPVDVHFTSEGSRLLGEQVGRRLRGILKSAG